MMDSNSIDDLAKKLAGMMPASLARFQEDIEKNLKAGLKSAMQKMDLVTREEYEVQRALLERSQARLAALEDRIAALEASKDQG